MFNALNRFISRLDGDAQPRRDQPGGYGFQVLRNTNLDIGIEPWFDFIVGINGRVIDNPDPRLFAQEVRNCAGSTVALGLWGAKGARTRVSHIPVPVENPNLGLCLQWESLDSVSNIWHVLDVAANSPADNAGLLPYSDYILGTPDGVLHGESGLGEMVDDYIGRPLKLWVYNQEYNVTREVEIQPTREWGGEGALGCILGYGHLHRLPAPLEDPVTAPGETMFDGDGGAAPDQFTTLMPQIDQVNTPTPPAQGAPAGDFLIPAQMAAAPPTSAPPRGKKKDKHGLNPNRLMDDYFAEEEKKSKELDGPSRAKAIPPPPPPKVGPPRASPQVEEPRGDGDE